MSNSFIEREIKKGYFKKVIILSIGALIWFIFGAMLILRDSVKKDELKVLSGELVDWNIVEVQGSKQMIDVLTFNIKNHTDKVALYLNSIEEYKPLTDKLVKGKLIRILYNNKGHSVKEGYNLHIYEIKNENEILVDFDKQTKRGKIVGLILFGVGLLFILALLFITQKERKRKTENHLRV